MTPKQKTTIYESLLPVVVGAFLGAVPAIVVSELQSRAAVRQIVVERQFAAIKDFSSACTRNVELAGRLVLLFDMRQIGGINDSTKLMEDLLRQQVELNRDTEESRISLQAQADLSNALFSTQITPLPDAIPEPFSQPNADQEKKIMEKFRQSLPARAKQCQQWTALLVSKLER